MQEFTTAMASVPMALPWEWIVEKLVDNKEIDTALLKGMIRYVPDIKRPSCSSLQQRIALRYLEEILFAGKFEAHAIPLIKVFVSSSSQDSTDAEDLLLRICTEVVLGHIREVDEDGERDWEGFEDDLNQVFTEDDFLLPFIGRRNELLGLLKNKSSYLSALKKYPLEVLKSDLLHFIHEKKACINRTVLDQLVCDITDGCYTCTSFVHTKHASTGEEIIQSVSRKRSYREATLEDENRSAEGQKRLKHSENDNSPSHVEKIKECIMERSNVSENDLQKNNLGTQTGNLNQNPQITNYSSAMGSREEVHCNRDKEILQESSSTESTNNIGNWNCSESTDNEVRGLEQQISEQEEENNSDTEGRKEDHILEAEELPEPDHLIPGNECLGESCFKCKDGGSLSYCDGCSIAVHYNCLQSDVSITSRESVGCPVCSYKKALTAYKTAKKEALESKKRLLAFMDIKAVQGNGQISRDKYKSKKQVLPDTGNTLKDHSSHPCAFNLASKRKQLPLHSRRSKSIVHENEIPDGIGHNQQFMRMDAHDGSLNGDLGESHYGNRKNIIRNKKSQVRSSKSIVHENEILDGIGNNQQHMGTDAHDGRLNEDLGESHNGDRKNRIHNKESPMRSSESIVHENEIPDGIGNDQQFMQTDALDGRLNGDLGESHYGDRKNRIRNKKSPMRSSKSIVHENEIPDVIGNDQQFIQTDALDGRLNRDLRESHYGDRKNRIRNKKSPMRSYKSIVHENEIPDGIGNNQQFMQTDALDGRLNEDLRESHHGDRKNRICNKKSPMRGSFRLPSARRNNLPWTKAEEEILKEGRNKFPCESNTIPWKRILEHGKGIFHTSRIAVDLKDKRRNMKKGSS